MRPCQVMYCYAEDGKLVAKQPLSKLSDKQIFDIGRIQGILGRTIEIKTKSIQADGSIA